MAKIENESGKTAKHVFEVQISFDALSRGETFSHVPDYWTRHGVAMGYLIDRGEEASDVGSGQGQG